MLLAALFCTTAASELGRDCIAEADALAVLLSWSQTCTPWAWLLSSAAVLPCACRRAFSHRYAVFCGVDRIVAVILGLLVQCLLMSCALCGRSCGLPTVLECPLTWTSGSSVLGTCFWRGRTLLCWAARGAELLPCFDVPLITRTWSMELYTWA